MTETVIKQKAIKPEGNLENAHVAKGLRDAPEAEVAGRGSLSVGAFYTCCYCDEVNWVPSRYDFFFCWSCGALNKLTSC